MQAEAGYGIGLGAGGLRGTPYAGLGLTDGARDYRIGWRLASAAAKPGFTRNLEGTRREAANDAAAAEHGVILTGQIRCKRERHPAFSLAAA